MSPIYITFDFITLMMGIVNAVIGWQVLACARRTGQASLRWLAVGFIAVALISPMSLYFIAIYPLTMLGLLVACVGIMQFVQMTFYQGRPSPYRVILVLVAGTGIVALYYAGLYQMERAALAPNDLLRQLQDYDVSTAAYARARALEASHLLWNYVTLLIVWSWHLWAGWQAYRQIAAEKHVEDWVKGRYQLVLTYCSLYVLAFLAMLAKNFLGLNGLQLVQPIAVILAVVLQFLAWVMPAGYQRWLNRHYKPALTVDLDKLTEAEVLKQL